MSLADEAADELQEWLREARAIRDSLNYVAPHASRAGLHLTCELIGLAIQAIDDVLTASVAEQKAVARAYASAVGTPAAKSRNRGRSPNGADGVTEETG